MNLSFQTPPVLVILIIIISFATSYFFYQFTVPKVSFSKRLLLIALRGTALMFMLLALCKPLLQLSSNEEIRPVLAVLVDNSLSMSQTDGTGNKKQILASILQSDGMKNFSSVADVQFYSFSYSIDPLIPESLNVTGGATNISGALQSSMKTIDGLRGMILLSDGNYNSGSNPLYAAEKSRIPIFTVGIGDTNEQKDVSVSKLLTNSIGYVDAAIPVDVTIKVSGLSAPSLEITLTEGDKKIDRKTIAAFAVNGVTEVPIQFHYTPKSAGVKKISVSISEVDGEITSKNNIRSAMVKVLKSKMNIVVVSGALSADVSTVMQTLNADNNINAAVYYQLPNGEFKHQKIHTELQSSLTTADVLIVIGFPTAQSSVTTVQMINRMVAERSLPILFVASRILDLQKLRLIERALPFSISSDRIDEQSVLPSISEKSRSHQLLHSQSNVWEKLPPIYYSLQTFSPKPEAQQLLAVKIQNVVLTNPLFLIKNVGATKSAALLGYGIHRWNILAGSSDETKNFFTGWLSSVIRWLSTQEQDKFLRVEPSREFYAHGERVTLTGQLYNESYQPVDDADVTISIRSQSNSERFETTLASLGLGLYEGFIDGLSEGDFSYSASALRNGDTLGTTTGRITVGEQSIEFAETKMNKSLLQQVANASGGIFADASSIDRLINTIRQREELKPNTRGHTREFELWNLPSLLTIIIVLFGLEWFLRKKSGML